jgi:hypothetical protein
MVGTCHGNGQKKATTARISAIAARMCLGDWKFIVILGLSLVESVEKMMSFWC